ncbi:MAG: alpha/beta fold hydrolase [Gemmatimonadota bacterium]|nr:alpha/beta fold hydrolase [Gemmatimonadota bacterium]
MSAQIAQTHIVPPRFRPAWWLRSRHAQTLAGKYLRSGRGLPLERHRVDTSDGDFLDLDFAPEPEPGAPLVVVLHGLEGSTQREYMSLMFRELLGRGLRGVGLNFRGCGGEPNRLPRAYHSGETGDLAHVIARLRRSRPGRPIGAVGFSLGDGSSKV